MKLIEWMRGYHRAERGVRVGRLMLHTIANSPGAPLLDQAWVTTEDGRRWSGRCLSLVWRRNRHGERVAGYGVFFGWRMSHGPAMINDRVAQRA